MASKLILIHFITAMVAFNLIFADEGLISPPERSANHHEDLDVVQGRQSYSYDSIVTCNYNSAVDTQWQCVGCSQALACYPNNLGRLRTCRGFLKYCNNGRCSFDPQGNCTDTE